METTDVSELACCPQTTQRLLDWLRQPAATGGQVAVLMGPHGCGKTTLARCAIRACGGRAVWVDASDLRGQQTWAALVDKALRQGNVAAMLSRQALSVLVIDNLQDPDGVAGLLPHLRACPGAPRVLGISDPSTKRLCPEVRTAALLLDVPVPTIEARAALAGRVLAAEGRRVNQRKMRALLAAADGDLRADLRGLRMLTLGFSYEQATALLRAPPGDPGLSDATHAVLYARAQLEAGEAVALFGRHRNLLPGMVQENYPAAVAARGGSRLQKLQAAAEIAADVCLGEALAHAFPGARPPLRELAQLCGCSVSAHLRRLGPPARAPKLAFTSALTRASMLQSNTRAMGQLLLQTGLPGLRFDTLARLARLCKALQAGGRDVEAETMLAGYRLRGADLARLWRADKVRPRLESSEVIQVSLTP